MDISFIEMEQSLREQMKEDQKQTMNAIQSICKYARFFSNYEPFKDYICWQDFGQFWIPIQKPSKFALQNNFSRMPTKFLIWAPLYPLWFMS